MVSLLDMEELFKLFKASAESHAALASIQVNLSKQISEMTALCPENDKSSTRSSLVSELASIQEALKKVTNLQDELMKHQTAMVLNCHTQRPQVQIFYKFCQLPPEVRIRIWEMALPDTRIFEPFVQRDGNVALHKAHKPPAIRSVCKEAWQVTETSGFFAFGRKYTEAYSVWFNPKRDIVVVEALSQIPINRQLIGLPLRNVELIALGCNAFTTLQDCEDVISWVVDFVPCCSEIIILTLPQHKEPRTTRSRPKLFNLRDEDTIWSVQDGVPEEMFEFDENVTWADLKEQLEMVFQSYIVDVRIQFDVPEIKGMELLR